jgi:hypothetical protein
MTHLWTVRRAALLHPGPVLGTVRASDLLTAREEAAKQFRGWLVSVSLASREPIPARVSSPVRYEPRRER